VIPDRGGDDVRDETDMIVSNGFGSLIIMLSPGMGIGL
jgi:hypothetical protein